MTAALGFQSDWWAVLTSDLMLRGLLGGVLVAIAAGLVGPFVHLRNEGFATHTMAHVGFPGAIGAALVGWPTSIGVALACGLSGLAIGGLGRRPEERDIATGTVLAAATALGVLLSSFAAHGTVLVTATLFGNLTSISTDQLVGFAAGTVIVGVVIAFVGRPLLFSTVSPDVAAARGVPTSALSMGFVMTLALVVTMAIQVVGTLLLFALVVTPSATAFAWTGRAAPARCASIAIGVAGVLGGLAVSAMFDLPPSVPIVGLLVVGWCASTLATRTKGRS
ncbi:MAG: metal ABC transporter permease [Microthrixaceae bacterium]